MSTELFQQLARLGAKSRLDAITAEQRQLLAAFPELSGKKHMARATLQPPADVPATEAFVASALADMHQSQRPAARRAASERMKARWAAKRAEQARAARTRKTRKSSRRAKWTKAQRTAVSVRMRRYWAKRRKAA